MSTHDDELLASFLRNRSRIQRYLTSRTGSRQDAEDLAQEAWIKLARNGAAAANAPLAYLNRIVRTLAIDHSRSGARQMSSKAVMDLLSVPDDTPGPAQIAEDRDQVRLLSRIVEDLPERQRRILIMARLEQRPQSDIAAELGVSVRTVEYDLRRALEYCSERIARINRR
ncbi:RNA polymerase sigma factor [Nitratireductor pacificus]|uniref:ECF family RNA polymerase sigma factor n=1 Tax=Nitratireductor pacificus pht-3B TaxID=391937 RepID=K2MIJ5_9HYPH|nr:RNA polymerase sigma factor [Nitratireductor pacificus]EKF20530.1 ECF family RNA polymerase sigma factor [Nitratireductor pacificus pht-3B]